MYCGPWSLLKVADLKLLYEPRLKLKDRRKGLGFSGLLGFGKDLASKIFYLRG